MDRDLPLLSVVAVAEALGTSERHIRELISRHAIPYVKVGAKVRFRPSAIESWLRANTVEASS